MKILKYIPAVLCIACVGILSWSCSNDDSQPRISVGDNFQILSPDSGSSFALMEDDVEDIMTTLTFEEADYGQDVVVNYELLFDLPSGDFSEPFKVTSSTTSSMDLTVGVVNNIILGMGFPAEQSVEVKAIVRASISENVDTLWSNELSFNIAAFQVQFPSIYVPGQYQDWMPEFAPEIYSVERNTVYDGYIYFGIMDGFKFTEGPNWDVNYGDTGADGMLDRNGDNIMSPGSGMHRLTVDLDDLSYSAVETNWAIIGDATPNGWADMPGDDTDMTFDEDAGVLTVTTDLSVGEMKFRANDSWDINFGDNDGNSSLEYGGDNIVISEAGNYTIELVLNVPIFTYRLIKN